MTGAPAPIAIVRIGLSPGVGVDIGVDRGIFQLS
jgi:hypothetical protein